MRRSVRRQHPFTLEELRTLEAVHASGSVSRAAEHMGKGHTGVLYALSTLEASTGLKLIDRSRHRSTLTLAGLHFLEGARHLLNADAELTTRIDELKSGWEPRLGIVADGVVTFEPIIDAIALLVSKQVPTAVRSSSAFLSGVELAFQETQADVMISVLPPVRHTLHAERLKPISASLVTHRDHPLAKGRRHQLSDLARYMLLTVHGSDPRLQLPTSPLEGSVSPFHVTDFGSKKLALLKGLGFGWMPDALIAHELSRETLVRVRWQHASTHAFLPRLYYRGPRRLGRAGKLFVERLLSSQGSSA